MAKWHMSLTKEQEAVVQKVLGAATPMIQFVAAAAGSLAGAAGGAQQLDPPKAPPAQLMYGVPFQGAPQPAVMAKYGLPMSCPRDPVVRPMYGVLPPQVPKPPNINTLYGITVPNQYGTVRTFFSDLQKQQMQAQGIKPCDHVDISPVHLKYGIVIPYK